MFGKLDSQHLGSGTVVLCPVDLTIHFCSPLHTLGRNFVSGVDDRFFSSNRKDCLFILVIVSFAVQSFLNLMSLKLSVFGVIP